MTLIYFNFIHCSGTVSVSVDELMQKMDMLFDVKLKNVATKKDIDGLVTRIDNVHSEVEILKLENNSLKSEIEKLKRKKPRRMQISRPR